MQERRVAEFVERGRIVQVAAGVSVREACRLMAREKVGAVLVVEAVGLRGIFTERDALSRVIARDLDPERTLLADVMTLDPITVTPQSRAIEALRLMRDGGFRHLPVVEEGKLVGVISLRDFVGAELAIVEREARVRRLAGKT